LNNETGIIKGRVDAKIYNAFKSILNKLNLTQQDYIDKVVRDFVLENINLVMDTKSDKK